MIRGTTPDYVLTLTVILILFGLAVGMWLIAAASAEIERRHERYRWEHPPEEGVCREDDADE